MHRWLMAVLLLSGSLLALAAGERGILKGTVTYDGGAPCPKAAVTVIVGNDKCNFTADKEGAFTGMVPAGHATVSTYGASATVNVTPGEITLVSLVITASSGVVLTVTYPDGTPHTSGVFAGIHLPGKDPRYPNARPLGPGRYWFADVPPEATDIAVRAFLTGSYIHGDYLKRWTFAKPEKVRTLSLVVPKPVHVVITVVDEAGKPVINAPLDGRVFCMREDLFALWPSSKREPYLVDGELRYATKQKETDGQGKVDLGNLVPQSYTLILHAGDQDGAAVPFVVKADGTFPTTYTVHASRPRVTHLVYGTDGQPLPRAEVFASFCRAGKAVILKGTADEAGRVTWPNLPRTRVIVSGLTVQPQVIPAQGEAFDQPLPAPTPEPAKTMRLGPRVDGEKPVMFGVVFTGPGLNHVCSTKADLHPPVTGAVNSQTWSVPAGVPFTLLHVVGSVPSRVKLLRGAMLPYLPAELPQIYLPMEELPYAVHTGVEVRVRLVDQDGKAAAGELQVLPAEANDAGASLREPGINWLFKPERQEDGTLIVSLPTTGAYLLRARPNASAPYAPGQTIDIRPGMPAKTVVVKVE